MRRACRTSGQTLEWVPGVQMLRAPWLGAGSPKSGAALHCPRPPGQGLTTKIPTRPVNIVVV